MQDLDTEVVIATAREGMGGSTAVAANIVVDERQMNKLFLDVVSVFIITETETSNHTPTRTSKYRIIMSCLFDASDAILHLLNLHSFKSANLMG